MLGVRIIGEKMKEKNEMLVAFIVFVAFGLSANSCMRSTQRSFQPRNPRKFARLAFIEFQVVFLSLVLVAYLSPIPQLLVMFSTALQRDNRGCMTT